VLTGAFTAQKKFTSFGDVPLNFEKRKPALAQHRETSRLTKPIIWKTKIQKN